MPKTEEGLAKQRSQKNVGKAGISHGYKGRVWNVDESMTYLRKKKSQIYSM